MFFISVLIAIISFLIAMLIIFNLVVAIHAHRMMSEIPWLNWMTIEECCETYSYDYIITAVCVEVLVRFGRAEYRFSETALEDPGEQEFRLTKKGRGKRNRNRTDPKWEWLNPVPAT